MKGKDQKGKKRRIASKISVAQNSPSALPERKVAELPRQSHLSRPSNRGERSNSGGTIALQTVFAELKKFKEEFKEELNKVKENLEVIKRSLVRLGSFPTASGRYVLRCIAPLESRTIEQITFPLCTADLHEIIIFITSSAEEISPFLYCNWAGRFIREFIRASRKSILFSFQYGRFSS